jgi:putative aldouronate transport system permease protein
MSDLVPSGGSDGRRSAPVLSPTHGPFLKRKWQEIVRAKYLLLLLTPGFVYYVIFHYLPMYGVVIAFQDYRITRGVFDSDWVGFKHFIAFFNYNAFPKIMRNTIMINVVNLVLGFPIPIILAIMITEVPNSAFRRTIQTITYLPHFISVVIIAGMVITFLSPRFGIINLIINRVFGLEPVHFLTHPEYFWFIHAGMNIWKGAGWGSIIYIAAISGVNPELYEAAIVDGAGRFRRIWHITLPAIRPTIMILLILNLGRMLTVGAESILLLYNPTIYDTADVISTFVYRRGLLGAQWSFATAVGVFNSLINLILLSFANYASSRTTGSSLW